MVTTSGALVVGAEVVGGGVGRKSVTARSRRR